MSKLQKKSSVLNKENIQHFKKLNLCMSRTYGVSIFIDYCTALATRRKVEGEERDIQLINVNEANSCLA
jgi:hypothetical protein